MSDLTVPIDAAATSKPPKGVAFSIADLLIAESWANFHDIGIVVRLDHAAKHEDYEEVIEFQADLNSQPRLIMWRDDTTVFVQPLAGARQRHASIIEALRELRAEQQVAITDITATSWPVD
ncbi:hypothetical protein [Rhodopila sp.]|uniref:hypothetical protein n=1 Tax=Rhodopila sp. TaxID=2480087 RepID=UPI003D14584A